jgi:hypothetical protein
MTTSLGGSAIYRQQACSDEQCYLVSLRCETMREPEGSEDRVSDELDGINDRQGRMAKGRRDTPARSSSAGKDRTRRRECECATQTKMCVTGSDQRHGWGSDRHELVLGN